MRLPRHYAPILTLALTIPALAQPDPPIARLNEALQLVAQEHWTAALPLLSAIDPTPLPVPVRVSLAVARARAEFAGAADQTAGFAHLAPARERLETAFHSILETLLREQLSGPQTDFLHRIAVELVRESAEIPLWFGEVTAARDVLATSAHRFDGQIAGVTLSRMLGQLDWIGQSIGDIAGPGLDGRPVHRPTGGVQLVLFWTPTDERSRRDFRYINQLLAKYGPALTATGICINEPSRQKQLDDFLHDNPPAWPQIRDPAAWDSPLVQRLGIHRTGAPQFLLVQNERVIHTSLWGFYGRKWVARALGKP